MVKKKTYRLKKKTKTALAIFLGVAVIAVGYLGLCVMADENEFLGNTVINGVDVGEMSKDEAIAALSEQYAKDTHGQLTMAIDGKNYTIDTKDAISFDVSKGVNEVYETVNESFLKKGYYYLVGNQFVAPIEITDLTKLEEVIKDSGILEFNTGIDTTYTLLDNEIEFTKGKEGEKVTLESLVNDIKDALATYNVKDPIECSTVKAGDFNEEMERLHKELNKEAVNATLDKKNDYAIVPSQVGVKYDLETAKDLFSKVNEGETVKVPATITRPTVTTELLENNLFADTLGSYTTKVSGTAVRKNNVRLAGSKCHNVILLPGEEFSYNGSVGERTEAAGFGAAGAYVAGETVDVIGGGVCQPSSTLYNAVMLANLKITERHPHSYKSGYVPIGRDAMVSWGSADFRFVNTTDYPIKVTSSYSNSRLTMKIIGTNLEGITVKITSKQLSMKPYTTIEKEDPTLEVGKRVTQTSGYNSYTAQSWRHVYDKNGKLISSGKEAYSSYKKRNKVVLVGTKPVTTTPSTPGPTTPGGETTTPETTTPGTTTQETTN